MEEQKKKGVNRFIAFLLIAAAVVSIVIFAASGKEASDDSLNPPEGSLGAENGTTGGEPSTPPAEDDQGGEELPPPDEPKEEEPPEQEPSFIHTITGLKISEEEKTSNAFGIVIDPSRYTYGLSYADIAIEFPIEDGSSRMLFFSSSCDTVWKIGTLAPTRDYITAMAAYFGGAVIAFGRDDRVVYSVKEDISASLDLSKHADCYYTEAEERRFTNENLIGIAYNRTQLALQPHGYKSAPYVFADGEIKNGIGGANKLTLPYSETDSTTLVYNELTGKYDYQKNNEKCVDMLTGQTISFTNVFVLFADTTTYESSSGSECVFDTSSGGKGYYISGGRQVEFTWSVEGGELVFRSLSGDILAVSEGNAYITYYKASKSSSVTVQS